MINIKKILNYLIIGGLFLTPFIVFLVPSGMFFPYIAGKGFAFRFLIEIIFGLFVILAFIDKDYRPRLSWITKAILLFTGLILLSDLLGQNVQKSLWSNYERMEGFVLLAHLVGYYIVASSVLKTKEWWVRYFNTTILGSIVMSGYGLLQLAGKITISQGGVRLDGTFGNSAYLAIYLVFHIFLCMYMIATGVKKNWYKWLYGGVAVLETILLYFTATRGAILGFIGGIIIAGLLIVWKEKENTTLRKFAYYALGAVLAVVLIFVAVRNTAFVKSSPVLARFSTLSITEFQTQGRYYVWPMAVKGVLDRPVFGWGQENFNFVFNKYYNPGLFGQEEWFDRTHDLVLDWMIAGGLVGFLAYLSIYIAFFYYIWRRQSTLSVLQKSIITGLISAYIFHNIFVFDYLISYIIFYSILAYIHSVSFTPKEETSKYYLKTFSDTVTGYIIIPVVIIATCLTIYFVNIPAYLANINLIKALSPQAEGVEKNLELFKKVFAYNSFGSSEALEQVTQAAIQVNGAQSNVTDALKKEYYDFTRKKIEEKIAANPIDARYLVFAGNFFNQFKQYDEAVKYLEKAHAESPNKQSIYFELGTAYLMRGDSQKMFDLFKQAYELKPSAKESQIIYAVGAIYTKNNDVLKQMLAIIPNDVVISDPRFLRAYSDIGESQTVINILNTRLQKNPNDSQSKLTLASVYINLGQKQKAIDLIREVIVAEPSFKETGENYIKQLQGQ